MISIIPLSGFGFHSYSNINPFDAVKSTTNPFLPPTPSPKSSNPYSAPSPTQNPFMTYVDSKTNLWSTVSASAISSSSSGTTPEPLFSGSKSKRTEGGGGGSDEGGSLEEEEETNSTKKRKVAEPKVSSEEQGDEDNDTTDDVDDNTEEPSSGVYGKIYQLPDAGPVLTGEEGEECILQMRVKLYRLQKRAQASAEVKTDSEDTPTVSEGTKDNTTSLTPTTSAVDLSTQGPQVQADWIEVGIGPFKLLKSIKSAKPDGARNGTETPASYRVVMRRESNRGGPGEPSPSV